MELKDISIIGLGLIGGSLAKAIKKSNLKLEIAAWDRPDVLKAALEDKSIDKTLHNVEEALSSELIFLCLPVNASLEVFKTLAPKLNEGTVITDVSGVKLIFKNIWKNLKSKGIYIGGHPMTGKEKGGYSNSDPLLFENSIYILTDCDFVKIKESGLQSILEAIGARVACLDSESHDRAVANVSHLPQLLSVSLVNSSLGSDNQRNFTNFAAGGFRDMTRIASSDFGIWEPVIRYNKEEILKSLESLGDELKLIKDLVYGENYKTLSEKFEEARVLRDEIPQNTKGFLNPLFDIFVYVKDEPGVISKISTTLAQENINIKDIELLKIREGSGGTFRLSFDSSEDAESAHELLRNVGYTTK